MTRLPIKYILSSIILVLILSSCSNFAVSTKDDPDCETVVSGRMTNPLSYDFDTDVMVLKKRKSHAYILGQIINKTDDGYIFKPDSIPFMGREEYRSSYNIIEREYKFSEIKSLLDQDANLIHGYFPKIGQQYYDVNVLIQNNNKPDEKYIILPLERNSDFSFCLESGFYSIVGYTFILYKTEELYDYAIKIPNITFEVKKNRNNYIGDLIFNSPKESLNKHNILTKIGSRGQNMYPGLIGGLVYATHMSLKNEFNNTISIQDKFTPAPNKINSLLHVVK